MTLDLRLVPLACAVWFDVAFDAEPLLFLADCERCHHVSEGLAKDRLEFGCGGALDLLDVDEVHPQREVRPLGSRVPGASEQSDRN